MTFVCTRCNAVIEVPADPYGDKPPNWVECKAPMCMGTALRRVDRSERHNKGVESHGVSRY